MLAVCYWHMLVICLHHFGAQSGMHHVGAFCCTIMKHPPHFGAGGRGQYARIFNSRHSDTKKSKK